MSHSLTRRRLVTAAVAAVMALVIAPQEVLAKGGAPDVPTDLQVPQGNSLFLVGHAEGVQIYGCSITASGLVWTLQAPRATLYGENGARIATHFAGPTWEANDGSRVVGKREAGATVDPTAIPWLKLSVVSATPGPEGARLARTTFIQRLNTVGGLPPSASECNTATVGTSAEVPYTADYYFWR